MIPANNIIKCKYNGLNLFIIIVYIIFNINGLNKSAILSKDLSNGKLLLLFNKIFVKNKKGTEAEILKHK